MDDGLPGVPSVAVRSDRTFVRRERRLRGCDDAWGRFPLALLGEQTWSTRVEMPLWALLLLLLLPSLLLLLLLPLLSAQSAFALHPAWVVVAVAESWAARCAFVAP